MPVLLLMVGLALMFVAMTLVALVAGLLPFLLIFMVIGGGLAVMAFWIWMLVDAIQNRGLGEGEKIGWVLAIVFLHVLAAIVYFFVGRPKAKLLRPAMVDGV